MEYQLKYDAEEDCIYMTVTGDVAFSEFKTIFIAAWESEQYVNASYAVWDFSNCRSRYDPQYADIIRAMPNGPEKRRYVSDLAMAAARELAEYTRNNRPSVLPNRVAVLAANDVDRGTMRVYAGLTGRVDGELQVFKDIEQARAWLLSTPPKAG